MKYKVKLRKRFFWKTLTVSGHRYDKESNRMDFFFEDGGLISFGEWDKYDLKLDQDWALAVKKQMEKESGQKITTSFD